MNFSICSWTFGNIPLEEVIQFSSRIGYDEIEVGAAVDKDDWSNIKQLAKSRGISIRGINADASFLRPETDLANQTEEVRQQAIDHFKKQLDIGAFLEAEYIVLAPAAPGRSIPFHSESQDRLWAIDSIKQLAPYAKKLGITIVIEPLNRYESCLVNNARDAKQFLKEVNEPNVKTMLDTFHMNIEEKNFEEPFVKLKDLLETVHVADSNRQGIGYGHIPFEEVAKGLKKANYNKTITLESLVPGRNPFDATRNNMDLIYQYAENSLKLMHKYFS